MTTTGINQVTRGMRIQGKYDAAYEPVISILSYSRLDDSNFEFTCEVYLYLTVLRILNKRQA
jgi:hypothetical protein